MPNSASSLAQRVISEFRPRFAVNGRVLYREGVCTPEQSATARLVRAVARRSSFRVPDLVIEEPAKRLLILCDLVPTREIITEGRRQELADLFRGAFESLVFVTVAESRKELSRDFQAWNTVAWAADEPDHLIHFNGERFLGPYPDVLGAPPP